MRVDDAESCPRYIAAVVSGVQVGPSPDWLRQRLESIGQRTISNVVDATNYVLHGLGQPVHAFDLAKLSGRGIVVRPTVEGEAIVTLDGASRPLATGTTVICDGARPVALAGVMGGLDSEVTASTTDVLLEVAVFAPRFVRRVRRAVNLSTDASYRYERGVDAGDTLEVARTAAALIAQVAGGQVVEFIDVGGPTPPPRAVTLRPSRVARVLGMVVAPSMIRHHLEALGCTIVDDAHGLVVTPPTWRHDLLIEVDLIEEVARLVGFDSLPDELRPFRPGNAPDHPLHLAGRRVRDLLVGMGLAETRPMPFTSTGDGDTPRVRNPLADDEPFLRASILDTLARRAEYNLTRMQGNLRLFEVRRISRSHSLRRSTCGTRRPSPSAFWRRRSLAGAPRWWLARRRPSGRWRWTVSARSDGSKRSRSIDRCGPATPSALRSRWASCPRPTLPRLAHMITRALQLGGHRPRRQRSGSRRCQARHRPRSISPCWCRSVSPPRLSSRRCARLVVNCWSR